MTCDRKRCDNPDIGTIHGDGQYCINCMVAELNDRTVKNVEITGVERDPQ